MGKKNSKLKSDEVKELAKQTYCKSEYLYKYVFQCFWQTSLKIAIKLSLHDLKWCSILLSCFTKSLDNGANSVLLEKYCWNNRI